MLMRPCDVVRRQSAQELLELRKGVVELLARVFSEADAEDLCHEAFLAVLTRGNPMDPAKIFGFLLVTARRLAITYHRRRVPPRQMNEGEEAELEQKSGSKPEIDHMLSQIFKLTHEEQRYVELWLTGLGTRGVGRELQLSEWHSKTMFRQIKSKLQLLDRQ